MKFIPGTRALRTLVAAGRHLNFTRAADELGLTPAAVSHQIKEIEDQLGAPLFFRTGRTLRLTEAGTIFFAAAEDAIANLSRAASRIHKLSRGNAILRISVPTELATKWLMLRLEQFRKAHPTIDLRFDISHQTRDFELDDIDIAIRFGTGRFEGMRTDRLFGNVIVPVCSPRLIAASEPLNEPRDLLQHTLAHIEWSGQGITWPNWRMWMTAAGINDFDDARVLTFSSSSDAIEAAITGVAIALADYAIVANDLAEGRLVQPFSLGIRTPEQFAYFLVYPEKSAADPRIVAFREWVLSEAEKVKM
jgi:LysR family transcriptional regulator, glycine cleavage system transcriptional activator